MMHTWFKDADKTIFIVLSFLLMVYLILRAIFVPILNDEVATFFFYVQSGEFLPFLSHPVTNNHFLNSALSFFFYKIFGSSQFVLRLPNVLSAILLFYYTYKLGTLIKDKFLRWVFILSILFAHNFIEFLALSRGYGMSMVFLVGVVYFLMLFQQTNKIKHCLYCLILTTLSMSANLTLIISGLIVISLIIMKFLLTRNFAKKQLCPFLWTTLLSGIIPVVFFIWISFEYKARGMLLHGTTEGFWQITAESILKLISGKDYTFVSVFCIIYFATICCILIYALITQKSLKILIDNNFTFFWLFIGNILACVLLAKFFGVNFPQDRTGLYFYPLFIGSIIFMFDHLQEKLKFKYLKILAFPLLLIIIHFLFHLNIDYVFNHKYSTMPERFYHKIKSDWKLNTPPPTVSGHGLQSLCWDYFNYRDGGCLNQMQTAVFPNNLTDYQIVHIGHYPEWLRDYDIIDSEKTIYLSLLKRKDDFKKELILGIDSINTSSFINRKSFVMCDARVDTLAGQDVFIDFDLSIICQNALFYGNIVVSLRNKEDETIYHESIELRRKQLYWTGLKSNFLASYILPISDDAYKMIIYLFNYNLQLYIIYDGEVRIYKAKS